MALIRGSAGFLFELASSGKLIEKMTNEFVRLVGQNTSQSEVKSWTNSIFELLRELKEAKLEDVEVILEYRLPLSSKRVDALLAGVHPKTKRPSFVVVELKQWSEVQLWESNPDLVVGPGFMDRPRLHPSLQVDGYVDYIEDFIKFIPDSSAHLSGVAFLHNLDSKVEIGVPEGAKSQVFAKNDSSTFRKVLTDNLNPESGSENAEKLLKSAVAPSRQLMKLVAQQLNDRDQFVLLDNQRLAVDIVRHAVQSAFEADRKRIVLVTGGPGSGKSVVALTLLADLAVSGRSVVHATGSKSFTQTIREVAGQKVTKAKSTFKYFNNFMDAKKNELDVLIMDEAHRLRETSATRFTAARFRTGRTQLDEVVSAARVPVFLLDENQVVRPGEMGSVEEISEYATTHGLELIKVELTEQFRCGGSSEFVEWVESVLGISNPASQVWAGNDRFHVSVVSSPSELESVLHSKLEVGYGARMTAGFCWPWSEMSNGQLVDDVVIGDWRRPWNSRADRKVGDIPSSSLWATDPDGFGQVGCIYTAQGFEYDWNGVIFGPDLVVRNGMWVVNRSALKDSALNKSAISDEDLVRLLKNVYKVLMTRGMQGLFIYSVDAETQDFFRTCTT
jgi:hypothetical protein